VPKRQAVKTHETDEVQGEDSFVVLTGVKVREIREIRKLAQEDEKVQKRNEAHREAGEPEEEVLDQFEGGLSLLAGHIIKWNWVDDDDQPLVVPAEDPSVIDELTNEEVEYLTELLMGKEAAKN